MAQVISNVPAVSTTIEYLPWLLKRGLKIKLTGTDKFSVEPKLLITDKLRNQIKEFKDILLAELHMIDECPEERILMLLAWRGWAVIRSKSVGGVVLLVKDDEVRIPDRFNSLTSYTWNELKLLVEMKVDREHLLTIHETKKMFGGRLERED
jgi:hypothetical protein